MPVTGPVSAGAQPANAAPQQTPNASAFDAVVFNGWGRHAPDVKEPEFGVFAEPALSANRMLKGPFLAAYWGVRHEGNFIYSADPEVHSYLIGGDKTDELVDGPSNDRLFGGPGIDFLYGGKGKDALYMSIPPDKTDKESFETSRNLSILMRYLRDRLRHR